MGRIKFSKSPLPYIGDTLYQAAPNSIQKILAHPNHKTPKNPGTWEDLIAFFCFQGRKLQQNVIYYFDYFSCPIRS